MLVRFEDRARRYQSLPPGPQCAVIIFPEHEVQSRARVKRASTRKEKVERECVWEMSLLSPSWQICSSTPSRSDRNRIRKWRGDYLPIDGRCQACQVGLRTTAGPGDSSIGVAHQPILFTCRPVAAAATVVERTLPRRCAILARSHAIADSPFPRSLLRTRSKSSGWRVSQVITYATCDAVSKVAWFYTSAVDAAEDRPAPRISAPRSHPVSIEKMEKGWMLP